MTKNVPADSDLLCENCGYILNGLPQLGNCPECGSPIAGSAGDDGRQAPAWEDRGLERGQGLVNFIRTSAAVILRPGGFFRHTTARGDLRLARRFASIHWLISSGMFAATAIIHANWIDSYRQPFWYQRHLGLLALWSAATAMIIVLMVGTTRLVARLTAFEAAYRELRLPRPVVLRALYYHSAHFFPVALLALLTVDGFTRLVRHGTLSTESVPFYLLVLGGEVIVCAAYLFWTYWAAMKAIMYANR